MLNGKGNVTFWFPSISDLSSDDTTVFVIALQRSEIQFVFIYSSSIISCFEFKYFLVPLPPASWGTYYTYEQTEAIQFPSQYS